MEDLVRYVWKHRLFPLTTLFTTDGQEVEVVSPGMENRNDGPDFFNAKVKIDGTLWVGNVEIHGRSSDWYRHLHSDDPAYSNVVLHVVGEADCAVAYPDGVHIPQLVLPVPDYVGRVSTMQACVARHPEHHRPRLDGCAEGREVGTAYGADNEA